MQQLNGWCAAQHHKIAHVVVKLYDERVAADLQGAMMLQQMLVCSARNHREPTVQLSPVQLGVLVLYSVLGQTQQYFLALQQSGARGHVLK